MRGRFRAVAACTRRSYPTRDAGKHCLQPSAAKSSFCLAHPHRGDGRGGAEL